MKKVINYIYNNLELYCSICHYNNYNHKVILITDEKSLKKENITLDIYTKDFNIIIDKTKILKNKIDNEIKEINNLYEKVNNEVTNSFILKHEKLIKEENEIKDKLKNEVNKIKENLEKYINISNNNIKLSERINKGINLIDKNNKEIENMIKIMSYITKINKIEKEMNNIFNELMRNIKISYNKEKNIIKYEDYYFNGIPKPNNIKFKDISYDNLNIEWKIDKLNINNFEYKNIKYEIEMRKENKIFKKIYEGNNNNYKINNLKAGKNYEFRIRTIYNDCIGSWTDIQKIKTNDIGNILKESGREKEFNMKLIEWSGYKKIELIYRGSRDGTLSKNFHEKCDNKGPTITLIKNEKGNIFGGFSSISWTSQNNNKQAPNSFLFSLTNIYGINPTKFQLKNNNDSSAIYDYSNKGATFGKGSDLYVSNDFNNKNNSYSKFPSSYEDSIGKGKSIFTGDTNNNNEKIKIKEIEVFKLYN